MMRVLILALLGGCTAQAAVTQDTVANCLALSPSAGDRCYPSDSGYTMTYDGSAWLYQWNGYTVTPPVDANWSDLSVEAGGTYSEAAVAHTMQIPDTGATATEQTAKASASEGETHTLCMVGDGSMNGTTTAQDLAILGFHETASDKHIDVRLLSGFGQLDVPRRSGISGTTNSNAWTENSGDHHHRGRLFCAKLVWASDVLSFSYGESPSGPWKDLLTGEGEASYFTTSPDGVIWGAVNRSGVDQFWTLVHHGID
jgi:hypothetical protein